MPTSTHRLSFVCLLLVGCGSPGESNAPAPPRVEALASPAPAGSMSPGLTVGPAGGLVLTWQTRAADSSLGLWFAGYDPASRAWSVPGSVATGGNILASALDVPSVIRMANGSLVASWRGKLAARGYDLMMAASRDGGRTWSTPVSPHRDGTPTEHGFPSWVQLGDSTGLVWVDGRRNAAADTSLQGTALTFAPLDAAGQPLPERVVDSLICDCCHTSAAAVPGGMVVVYRDRQPGEIRDISAVRWSRGGWGSPVSVHRDGWHIAACPVNGPSVAAQGATVAVAWFTMAHDTARVRLAFSTDAATSFGPPIEINEGRADGKVGLALLPSGDALVSWIERKGDVAVLRARRVRPDGHRSTPVDVATFDAGKRAGGMPRLALEPGGQAALLTWTDPAQGKVVVARLARP